MTAYSSPYDLPSLIIITPVVDEAYIYTPLSTHPLSPGGAQTYIPVFWLIVFMMNVRGNNCRLIVLALQSINIYIFRCWKDQQVLAKWRVIWSHVFCLASQLLEARFQRKAWKTWKWCGIYRAKHGYARSGAWHDKMDIPQVWTSTNTGVSA